uniref:Uncharacterized protein n=1 Tax=Solanum lycopersicum TaxID=4081 RepID=A0A3Q7HKL1_SOLLC
MENLWILMLLSFSSNLFVFSLKAKTIIYLASREIEEKTYKMSEPLLQPQTVKKSLQGFLQKRKK